jgi:hypothetical protein
VAGKKIRCVAALLVAVAACPMQKGFAQAGTPSSHKSREPADNLHPHIEPDLKKFLGHRLAPDNCGFRRVLMSEFVGDRMVLSDKIYGQDIGKGRKLYIGHMPHNATDVAAVIYDSDGRISAVAAMSCEWKKTGPRTLDRIGVFTPDIYVRNDGMKDDNISALKPWSALFDKLNKSVTEIPPRIHLMPVKSK